MGKKTNHLNSHTGESSNFRYDKMIPKGMLNSLKQKIVYDKNGQPIVENGKLKSIRGKSKISFRFLKKFYTNKRRMFIKNDNRKQLENLD